MKRIADQLKIKYDWYVCITRGGLQPCLDLAEFTKQTNIDTLCITSYDKSSIDKKLKGFCHNLKNLNHLIDKKVLLIDDIVDSGDTLRFAIQFINRQGNPSLLHTATVYVKPHANILPDFYIELLPDNDYIIFPWEMERSIT